MVGKFDGVIFISFIDTPDSSYSELNGAPNHGSGIGGINMYMGLKVSLMSYYINPYLLDQVDARCI